MSRRIIAGGSSNTPIRLFTNSPIRRAMGSLEGRRPPRNSAMAIRPPYLQAALTLPSASFAWLTWSSSMPRLAPDAAAASDSRSGPGRSAGIVEPRISPITMGSAAFAISCLRPAARCSRSRTRSPSIGVCSCSRASSLTVMSSSRCWLSTSAASRASFCARGLSGGSFAAASRSFPETSAPVISPAVRCEPRSRWPWATACLNADGVA